jgi:hypothetical protein
MSSSWNIDLENGPHKSTFSAVLPSEPSSSACVQLPRAKAAPQVRQHELRRHDHSRKTISTYEHSSHTARFTASPACAYEPWWRHESEFCKLIISSARTRYIELLYFTLGSILGKRLTSLQPLPYVTGTLLSAVPTRSSTTRAI